MASLIATSPPEIRNGSLNGTWMMSQDDPIDGVVVVMRCSSVRDGQSRSVVPPPREPAGVSGFGRESAPAGPGEGRDSGAEGVQVLI